MADAARTTHPNHLFRAISENEFGYPERVFYMRLLSPGYALGLISDWTLRNTSAVFSFTQICAPTRKSMRRGAMAGCKDNEYSYDANFNGAFTFAALKAIEQLPVNATYQEWFQKIRQSFPHVQYPQTPQLSGSYEQRCKWPVFSD